MVLPQTIHIHIHLYMFGKFVLFLRPLVSTSYATPLNVIRVGIFAQPGITMGPLQTRKDPIYPRHFHVIPPYDPVTIGALRLVHSHIPTIRATKTRQRPVDEVTPRPPSQGYPLRVLQVTCLNPLAYVMKPHPDKFNPFIATNNSSAVGQNPSFSPQLHRRSSDGPNSSGEFSSPGPSIILWSLPRTSLWRLRISPSPQSPLALAAVTSKARGIALAWDAAVTECVWSHVHSTTAQRHGFQGLVPVN